MNTPHQERRREDRTLISAQALVRFGTSESWVCTIRDFCTGGMLLEGDVDKLNAAWDDEYGPSRGSAIDLHFALRDARGQARAFHHAARVARTTADGLGISFPQPLGEDALIALRDHAIAQSEETSASQSDGFKIRSGDAKRAMKLIVQHTQKSLLRLGRRFLDEFKAELVNSRNRASTQEERQEFERAAFELRDQDAERLRDFVAWVTEHLVRRQPLSSLVGDDVHDSDSGDAMFGGGGSQLFSQSKLSLVEKDQFENWLVVAEMASAYESQYSEHLFAVQAWMGLICEDWGRKERNPCAPTAFVRSFERMMRELKLPEEPAKVGHEAFDANLKRALPAYYDGLISQLSDSGIFPTLEEMIAEQVKQQSPMSEPEPVVVEERSDSTPVLESRTPALESRTPAAATALIDVANSLSGASDLHQGNELDMNQVLQALGRLPQTLDRISASTSIKDALLEQLADQGENAELVPKRVLNALDTVDHMVTSLEEDEVLTPDLRKWVKKLEVTLGKEAARNDGFLAMQDGKPHAAFQMLNQLEDVDGETIDMERGKRAAARVDAVLHRLVEDWEGNSDAFVDAVEELEPLVESQKRLYARNVERVVNGCEGKARLRRAKEIVLKCLVATLADRTLPSVVFEVIQPGWKNLLVNTALREGHRSLAFKQQLKIIRRVVRQLTFGQSSPMTKSAVKVLLNCIVEGFEAIGYKPRVKLITEVSGLLRGSRHPAEDELVHLTADEIPQLLEWETLIGTEPMPPTDEHERQVYLETLRRVRALRIGSRVKFEDPAEMKNATLAWVAPSGDQFVFVNRKGLWERELPLGLLTEQVVSGQAKILEGYDVPLVERVSERMLSRIHGQITDDVHKDELTQLPNRRSYEHSLDKLVALARQSETAHVVMQIDLDQFKIINSTCGYDGGDALLKELADALRAEVESVSGSVARIGADQFAAVLRDRSIEQAQVIAERLVRRVRHMQFNWSNTYHSITTTIGIVPVDQSSDDGRALLQHLESACREGKEQGGDCVYLYEANDQALLEQREAMLRASRVESLLADGRVQLNCQKIGTAVGDDPMAGHFEVLISVLNDEGVPEPPIDFIEAAERFGKMPLVDRYVVSGVLRWMAEHSDVVEQFGGFSINLSGQSIKQDDFLDFVLQQFEETGAAADKVCFEVTETAAMGNLTRAGEFIQKIKVLGCSFSLDDFGTGMSSYAYLRELPVDYLKIDGTFVKNMAHDLSDQAVVRSINEIGHFMGKRTVAEYVHDEATLEAAREIGVDYVQGWFIEKPKPIDALLESFIDQRLASA